MNKIKEFISTMEYDLLCRYPDVDIYWHKKIVYIRVSRYETALDGTRRKLSLSQCYSFRIIASMELIDICTIAYKEITTKLKPLSVDYNIS